MEDNNTKTPILDDGQYVDPLYYIAYSTPTRLQKVIYDFGGKPANTKEELYAMAAAMRAAPSGGKKFMQAVFSSAHPDTEDILAAIKKQPEQSKGCGCDACKKRNSSSYGGCGCSSFSQTAAETTATNNQAETTTNTNTNTTTTTVVSKEIQPSKSWLEKLPVWAKITGVLGAASLLTLGIFKIAQSASK